MTKTFEHRLAWLAGIMDGEGTISIYRVKSNYVRKDGSQSKRIACWAQVTNTNPDIINEVRALLDELGVKYTAYLRDLVPQRKPVWNVVANSSKQVAILLKALLPFLVGKREQARLVIETAERKAQFRKGSMARAFTQDEHEWLDRQLTQVHALNKTGRECKYSG